MNTKSAIGIDSEITGLSLKLECGDFLSDIRVAYQTYGTLNGDKSNVILICHPLSLNQYVGDEDPVSGRDGWWSHLVGAGKVIDTERFFVICQNVIGGCSGSTGPEQTRPGKARESDAAWAADFPMITIGDMVNVQAMVLDRLGIGDLFCVIGGSMGGMQVLEWSASHRNRVFSAIPIATAARHSPQNIAFHEVGRQAVMADPHWNGGAYYGATDTPQKGLAVARMVAHVTYLSQKALQRKFGRNLQDRDKVSYGFDADFQIESYLRHQGSSFGGRFDANSYLFITRAMDYFDIAADYGGNLAAAFSGTATRFCVISFTSDWLFPTSESIMLVRALHAAGANVSFVEIDSDKGHDAFLLNEPEMFETLRGFLNAAATQRGIV